MPTILQLRRGTESQNNTYTGAAGELTFDTSLNTIRAHDGITQGGNRLALYSEVLDAGLDSNQVLGFIDSAYIALLTGDTFDSVGTINLITSTIDSAYIQSKQADIFRDSAFVTGIVDTVYIQARDRLSTYGDSNVTLLVDSAYIRARQDDIFRDSAFVTGIIDSAYITARQDDIFRDSNFVTSIVDTVYIQARDRVRDSSFILDLIADDFVSSKINDTKAGNLVFDDDASLKLGTNGNLDLFYNSSEAVAQIKMSTAEELQINADVLSLRSRNGETYLNAIANSGVNLKYNNFTKLRTDDQGITVIGNVLPFNDSVYSLGSASKRWKDIWVSGNTIHLGDLMLQAIGGALEISSADSDGNKVESYGKVDPKNLDNAINIDLDSTSQQIIDSFDISSYRTARYIIQMEYDSVNKFHSTEILLMHNNTNVYMTEYAVLRTDSSLGDITADIVGDTVRLLITPSYNNTSIKAKRLIIDA